MEARDVVFGATRAAAEDELIRISEVQGIPLMRRASLSNFVRNDLGQISGWNSSAALGETGDFTEADCLAECAHVHIEFKLVIMMSMAASS